MAELRTPNFLGSMISGLQAGRESQVLRAKQAQEIAAAQERQTLNQMIQSGALTTEEGRNALLKAPGGLPILEAYGKLQEQSSKATQEETKSLEGRMQYWRRLIPADARLAPAWVEAAYADPIVGSQLSQLGSKEDVIAGIPRDPEGYMRWAEGASMFADKLSERRTLTAEQREAITTQRRGQDIQAATTRRGQDIERDTKERAQNLETFFGGGKPGKETAKEVAGAEAFEGVIGEMESAYDQLDRMEAIPSTRRTAAENIAISTRTSGAGQMLGRAAGTPEQSLRNQIQSARLRLLQGIKAATGMSAQELNSNVELQQWLDAVTNPANDVESNRAILNSIRTFVAKRAGREAPAAPPPAAPSQAAPAARRKTQGGTSYEIIGD
jgi:hypothetical protein